MAEAGAGTTAVPEHPYMRLAYLMQEMAPPLPEMREKVYWHGTSGDERAASIMQHGLDPSRGTTSYSGHLTPHVGHVYLTPNLAVAIDYAYGKIGDEGSFTPPPYIFRFYGKDLKNIEPDEDTISHIIIDVLRAKMIHKKEPASPVEQEIERRLPKWLMQLARKDLRDPESHGLLNPKFFASAAGAAKEILNDLPEWARQHLSKDQSLAHVGPLQPTGGWRLPVEPESDDEDAVYARSVTVDGTGNPILAFRAPDLFLKIEGERVL